MDPWYTRHKSGCATVLLSPQTSNGMGAQDVSTFFKATYTEKLMSEVTDRSLLTRVGGEVEIPEETFGIIRHSGVMNGQGGY